jgi:hypothetical protein
MIHRRKGVANDDIIYDDLGNAIRGCDFVGEDNLVRWFSVESQRRMEGIGMHNSSFGYLAYEDAPVEELTR